MSEGLAFFFSGVRPQLIRRKEKEEKDKSEDERESGYGTCFSAGHAQGQRMPFLRRVYCVDSKHLHNTERHTSASFGRVCSSIRHSLFLFSYTCRQIRLPLSLCSSSAQVRRLLLSSSVHTKLFFFRAVLFHFLLLLCFPRLPFFSVQVAAEEGLRSRRRRETQSKEESVP